jgi:hypothetical protein
MCVCKISHCTPIKYITTIFQLSITKRCWALVMHDCNSSYLGGRDREDPGLTHPPGQKSQAWRNTSVILVIQEIQIGGLTSRTAQAKMWDPIWKIAKANRAGGVPRKPEFKHQYWQTKIKITKRYCNYLKPGELYKYKAPIKNIMWTFKFMYGGLNGVSFPHVIVFDGRDVTWVGP